MPNLLTTEDCLSKVLVPPTQIHNSQDNMSGSESLFRTSKGRKKPLSLEVRIFSGNCNLRQPKEPNFKSTK